MTGPAAFIGDLLGKRPPAGHRSHAAYRQRAFVLKLLEEFHPQLVRGERDIILSEADFEPLIAKLRGSVDTPQGLRSRLNFLRAVLEKGRTGLFWQVRVPAPAKLIVRPRNRLTQESFSLISKVRRLEVCFIKDLERPAPLQQDEVIGQSLLSAILYGGLLDCRWVDSWLKEVVAGRIHRKKNLLWVEMERLVKVCLDRSSENWKDQRVPVSRRWVSDYLTASLLIGNYDRLCGVVDDFQSWKCLQSYFKRFDHAELPESLAELLKWAEARQRLYLSPFLVDYAAGRLTTVCLPAAAWSRLVLNRGVLVSKDHDDSLNIHVPSKLSSIQGGAASTKEQNMFLRGMLGAILPYPRPAGYTPRESRTALESYLSENGEQMVPYLQLLGHWAIELLIHRPKEQQSSPSGHRLRPSSVRRYLQAIGVHLVSEAGDLDPLAVDSDEIQVIYDAMLGNIPSASERAYAGRVLSYFHEYLRQVWKVAVVDLEGFTGSAGPKELGVDANIIDEHIVNVAIESLQTSGHDKRLRKIWVLILLLGYGCGLRRREALCLRMQDIHWDFSSELLIRRSVKTSDSMRRVPLDCLRSDLEELLYEWYQMRIKECGGKLDPQALFFCRYESPYELLAEQVVFNPIESALRTVTGDATLRFHHLRHSFATWMIFRHIDSRYDSMPHPFFEFGHYGDQCRELRCLTGHGGSNMRVLYMVAQLCGHVSPSTTLLHYIHLCDLLLAEGLVRNDSQPVLNETIVRRLTGFGRSTCFNLRRDSENWQMISFIENFADRKGKHLTDPYESQSFPMTACKLNVPTKLMVGLPRWETIQKALEDLLGRKVPVQEVSNRFVLPEAILEEWYLSCIMMAALKKRGGASKLGWGDKQYPMPPRSARDKQQVEQIMKAWAGLAETTRCHLDEILYRTIQNYRDKSKDVLCYDLDAVRKFSKCLELLKVPRTMIRLQYHPGNVVRSENPDALRNKIATQLGLDVSQIVMLTNDVKGQRYSIRDCLGIQVLAGDGSKVKNQKPPACYGVRYALTLLAIVRGVNIWPGDDV